MFTSSLRRRRPLVAVAVVTGALLLGGCSDSETTAAEATTAAESEETYAPDRLHSQIPSHVSVKVAAAMRGLTALRVSGEVLDDDVEATLEMAVDQDSCESTMGYEFGVAQVHRVQERTYLKGDFGFWTSLRDHHEVPGAAGAWSDRWVDVTEHFTYDCDLTSFSGVVPDFDVEEISDPEEYHGVEAVVITTTDDDRIVVANQAPYRVLHLETSDSDLQFSYDDVQVSNEVPDGVLTPSEAFELPPFEVA